MNIPILILCILIPLAVGGVSSFATASSIKTWFVTLKKPSFNPPNYLFAPVWTVLYILMGVSLYMIWQSPSGDARTNALIVFGIQLFLNFAWSFVFFYFRKITLALLDIMLLWIAIVIMILLFFWIIPIAAYLQIPYLLWVSFATALNGAIRKLN